MAVLCVRRTYQGGGKSRTPCAALCMCRVGWQQSRVNRYCINVGPFHLSQAAEWTKSMALPAPIKYTCFSRLPPPSTHCTELWPCTLHNVHCIAHWFGLTTEKCDSLTHIRFWHSFRFNHIVHSRILICAQLNVSKLSWAVSVKVLGRVHIWVSFPRTGEMAIFVIFF